MGMSWRIGWPTGLARAGRSCSRTSIGCWKAWKKMACSCRRMSESQVEGVHVWSIIRQILTAQAVSEWMETLIPREPMRVGIRAKVAVAREQDARSLLLALRAYEQECLGLLKLAPAVASVPSWKGLLVDCTRDAVDAQLRFEVEWARRTRRRVEEYLAQRG